MTLRASADVGFVLLAGYDIMGLITDLDEKTEAMLEQSDGLGAASDEYSAVGMTKFDLSFDGFYDDTTIQAIEALTGEQVLMYALLGNTIGLEFIGVNALRSTIARGPSRDGLTKAQIAFKSDEGPERGQVSAAHATVTAQGPVEGTSDDWGAGSAPSTDGGVGYVNCTALALDGGTALQVIIKDSDDDITFVDLITFTAIAAAPAAERKTVAGNVERYTLTEHEFTGASGASRTATFAAGFVRS
jgi:hypothetical protein